MNSSTSILVGHIGRVFWLRVEGRGTFQNSLQVKHALQAVMEQGDRNLVVDLERCPMMDSTFLGTLTGASLNLLEIGGGGSLTVLNANERNQQLLISLGLDHILELDIAGTTWQEERKLACEALADCGSPTGACKDDQARHVLDAHQVLANVNEDNECRFRDVIQFLQKEVNPSTPVP